MKSTMNRWEGERGLSEMVQLVQSTYAETMPVRDEGGLVRLERALYERGYAPTRTRTRSWRLPALAAAVILLAGGLFIYKQVDRVTYQVLNGETDAAGIVRATGGGAAIVFSEGSDIALGASARARIDRLTANGGRVVLESGSLHVRVAPRRNASWSVEAGPYSIRVTGTAFNVKWSWEDERLDVKMDHGSVIVTGPMATAGVRLTGGMRMRVDPLSGLEIGGDGTSGGIQTHEPAGDSQETSVAGGGAAPAGDSPTVEPATNLGDRPLARESATPAGGDRSQANTNTGTRKLASLGAPGTRRGGAERKGVGASFASAAGEGGARASEPWDRQLARGNVQGILEDAEGRGIDRVLVTVSGRELSALADAARYSHRVALARQVLLTVRERFPYGDEARDAAFFLGGLAEDSGGPGVTSGQAAALGWYDKYLRESPHGRYLAQALGRKMVLTQKLKGAYASRVIASEYLARFPGGPYASAARKLIQAN